MKKLLLLFFVVLYIGIAHSQNVGIGTTTPGAKLEVLGGVKVSDSVYIGGQLRITSGSPGAGKVLTSDSNGVATWTTPSGVHYIGESYGGGIVFFVYDNGLHGLISAVDDQSLGIQWYNGTLRVTGASGNGLGAGARNTAIIIAEQMPDDQLGNFAAKVCADYSVTVNGVTYGDWYLPSRYELNLLWLQSNVNGGVISGFSKFSYWSSTEYHAADVWNQNFFTGSQDVDDPKSNELYVRAIRAF